MKANILILLLLFFVTDVFGNEYYVTSVSSEGKSYISREESKIPISGRALLKTNDVLSSGFHGSTVVTLSDGSTLKLRRNTELYIDSEVDRKTNIVLLRGGFTGFFKGSGHIIFMTSERRMLKIVIRDPNTVINLNYK